MGMPLQLDAVLCILALLLGRLRCNGPRLLLPRETTGTWCNKEIDQYGNCCEWFSKTRRE